MYCVYVCVCVYVCLCASPLSRSLVCFSFYVTHAAPLLLFRAISLCFSPPLLLSPLPLAPSPLFWVTTPFANTGLCTNSLPHPSSLSLGNHLKENNGPLSYPSPSPHTPLQRPSSLS